MNTQHSSRPAVVLNTIAGKIASIVGYAITIILGLPLIFGAYPDAGTVIFVLVIIGLAIGLIIYGVKTKGRIKRFKKYINVISVENQTSLENIASITSQSIDFVTKDLQKMIDKKLFINAYIDKKSNEIILQKRNSKVTNNPVKNNAPVEMVSVICGSCGAANSVQKGVSIECEFCGSLLTAK